MKRHRLIFILFCLAVLQPGGPAYGQILDISSGGLPTMTGAVGGSVTGSSDVRDDLVVTINFGELSPANMNNFVKVTVPITVRSLLPYRVTATVSGAFNANPQAVQRTDVGFGVNNMRPLGAQAQVCNNSNHIFYAPFNNDPSANISILASGRAAYPSTLNNAVASTTILTGPRLTRNTNLTRQTNDGYAFDAIFVIVPQFYAPGTSSATITFTISLGPLVAC
jgi:hypothetical protein